MNEILTRYITEHELDYDFTELLFSGFNEPN